MNLGLLNVYHYDRSPDSYQRHYQPMCLNYLNKIMPEAQITPFLVAQGEYPLSATECDGWIITGSPRSVYDDEPWIHWLTKFIIEASKLKVKQLGICFGHQMIAQSLGGAANKAAEGWGVGVRSAIIKKTQIWMNPEVKSYKLLYSHQDQVLKLPSGAELLACSDYCPYQMYSIDDHILSMQGHPEFTKDYSLMRMKGRVESLGELTYREGVNSLNVDTDEDIIGQWINQFFKIKSAHPLPTNE